MRARDVVIAYLGTARMLEVRDLRVDYGAAPALWDVSLALGAGELRLRRRPQRRRQDDADQCDRRICTPRTSGRIAMDGRDITRAAAAPLLRRRHRDRARRPAPVHAA